MLILTVKSDFTIIYLAFFSLNGDVVMEAVYILRCLSIPQAINSLSQRD
jgi:hypothetical protein